MAPGKLLGHVPWLDCEKEQRRGRSEAYRTRTEKESGEALRTREFSGGDEEQLEFLHAMGERTGTFCTRGKRRCGACMEDTSAGSKSGELDRVGKRSAAG
ncbi:hypothetical protein GUJ93_ZPchr0004g39921 [Zizania palustris]|uniref:Uncharacterized protein n=1 Tax=Zizania palustris TaxID=103762 RepID=A0A8J5RW55_ZIZPA|nr:hypothetical protein GUJ93_ZPchr0004g39921 [Zizania palustris]